MDSNRDECYLFRGKADGKWFRGYLHVCSKTNHHHIIGSFEGDGTVDINLVDNDYVEVDPNTVGQCTGIRDKNRRLIFDGDIVNATSGYRVMRSKFGIINTPKIAIISWDNLNAQFVICIVNSRVRMWFSDIQRKKDIEVIGNIYENPELLNERTNKYT